jgi:putative ABC transport system permease protein
VRERTNEYGVLRALGFSPQHVFTFVIGEALAVGALTGLVALALGFPFVELGVGRWLEANVGNFFPYFRVEPKTLVAAVILPAALGGIAALLPAIQASRLSVTDALRRVA